MLQLWTCCLLCVCSLRLPDSIYFPKSLANRIWGFPVQDQSPSALGGEGATKLHFLSGLSSAIAASHKVFSLQLTKFLTGWYEASSWLQKLLLADILLIVQVICQKTSHKSMWGHKQVGSASTYSATIFISLHYFSIVHNQYR